MNGEIWVLGATGRTGRAVAARLRTAGTPVVLAGRSSERLAELAEQLGGPRVVAGSLEAVLAEVTRAAPAVVVNTVGPFTTTAAQVARACPPGTHYVDLANEYGAIEGILDLDREAVETDRTLVAGAGFGVFATESVLLRLCAGEPVPARVRVDAIPSLAVEPGRIGEALASSILDGFPAGGRRVEQGRLTRNGLGAEPSRLTTPDGDAVVTGSVPTGELLAAWRASRADAVVSGSAVIPTGRAVRAIIPLVSLILRVPAIARFATRRVARVTLKAADRPRPHSWGHARVQWLSGVTRDGWLRTGDAMDFTVAVCTEVALRLARGEGTPGAHTPGSLFGPDLTLATGADFVLAAPVTAE